MSAIPTLHNDAGSADVWWANRRLRYNIGLVVAGLVAFFAYAAVGEWCIEKNADVDFEITIFTIGFQGIGYLLMMGIANLCYGLGPLSERVIRPRSPAIFRKVIYALGFWFSVLLPFVVPILLYLNCVRAGWRAPWGWSRRWRESS